MYTEDDCSTPRLYREEALPDCGRDTNSYQRGKKVSFFGKNWTKDSRRVTVPIDKKNLSIDAPRSSFFSPHILPRLGGGRSVW
jgi:hypothetical protein